MSPAASSPRKTGENASDSEGALCRTLGIGLHWLYVATEEHGLAIACAEPKLRGRTVRRDTLAALRPSLRLTCSRLSTKRLRSSSARFHGLSPMYERSSTDAIARPSSALPILTL